VPFTTVHAGKYVTEDKSKTDTTKTKNNPEKDGWMVRFNGILSKQTAAISCLRKFSVYRY